MICEQWFCRIQILIMLITLVLIPRLGIAQCPQPFEGTYSIMPGSTDTIRSTSAYFTFLMPYSNCHVYYMIGEFKKNQQNLMLSAWCNGKILNDLSTTQYADSNSTQSFIVRSGDTLSFYRELWWINPANQHQLPNGYSADDNIDYAVELIQHSTGQRLALIDSLGVLSAIAPTIPDFHGNNTIMAKIQYVVPITMDSIRVRMRTLPYAVGNGQYYFQRTDAIGVDLSARLQDSLWISYLQTYGGSGMNKVSIENLSRVSSSNLSAKLSVISQVVRNQREVAIEYLLPNEPNSVSIMIYNSNAELIFRPLIYSTERSKKITYVFPDNNIFYVALVVDGAIVAVQKHITTE